MTRYQILETFAKSIMRHEGYFPPSLFRPWGSRSFRLKNPGNLKYLNQLGSIGKDKQNFAIFKDFEAGWKALLSDIEAKFNGNTRTGLGPKSTIYQFFKVYAPSGDSNDPWAYAMAVVKDLNDNSLKVTVNTLLGDLLNQAKKELKILAVLYNIKNQANLDGILGTCASWLQNIFGQKKEVTIRVDNVQGEELKYNNLLIFQGTNYIPRLGKEIDRVQLKSIYQPLLKDEKYVWFIDGDLLGNTVAIGKQGEVFVSEINYYDKGEILVTTAVLLHELLHSFLYNINSQGQHVEDRVHHYSFDDKRPEARFETYLNLLKPYWDKI